jgi:hypothetical protein
MPPLLAHGSCKPVVSAIQLTHFAETFGPTCFVTDSQAAQHVIPCWSRRFRRNDNYKCVFGQFYLWIDRTRWEATDVAWESATCVAWGEVRRY